MEPFSTTRSGLTPRPTPSSAPVPSVPRATPQPEEPLVEQEQETEAEVIHFTDF